MSLILFQMHVCFVGCCSVRGIACTHTDAAHVHHSTVLPARTSINHPQHKVYQYLLRNKAVTHANQVWAMGITYGVDLPVRRGGLVQPQGVGVAVVEQHGCGFLHRYSARSHHQIRYICDI